MNKYAHVNIKEGRILITSNPFLIDYDFHLKNFVISKNRRVISGDSFDWSWWIDNPVCSEPNYDEVEPEFMETIEKKFLFLFKYKVTQPKEYYIKKRVEPVVLKRVPPWTVVEIKNG